MKTSSQKLRGLIDQFGPVLTELKGYADLLDQKEALEEHLRELEAERTKVGNDVRAHRASFQEEQTATATAASKTLLGHGAAVKQLEDRIEDLGRQRGSLEARLEEIRSAIAANKAGWEEQKAGDLAAHEQAMRTLATERRKAESALAELQDRLRGVHATVGGLIQP